MHAFSRRVLVLLVCAASTLLVACTHEGEACIDWKEGPTCPSSSFAEAWLTGPSESTVERVTSEARYEPASWSFVGGKRVDTAAQCCYDVVRRREFVAMQTKTCAGRARSPRG